MAAQKIAELAAENAELVKNKQKYAAQQAEIERSHEKLEQLERKLQKVKATLKSTQDAIKKGYVRVCEAEKEQKDEFEKVKRMTDILLEVLRKKDEEIYRLQNEKNYLVLKLQGIV